MKCTPPPLERSTAFNYLSALMMLAVVVLLFTPFWHFGEGEAAQAVSINSYVWFPGDHADLEVYFQNALGEKTDINQIIVAPILLLVFSALGTVICTLKADNKAVFLLPLAVGIAGICGFSTVPALRLGSTWILMLILCITLVCLALASVAQMISMCKHV